MTTDEPQTPAPSPQLVDAGGRSRGPSTWAACGLSVLIATAALPLIGDLGNSLRVPLSYEEDGLLYLPVVKGVYETGTQWTNPRLAAPDGFVLYDFPMPEVGHFLTLRVLGQLAGDWVVGFNLFILIQFPLAALSGTWVARRFGIAVLPAVLVGVLFSYVPHHTLLYHKHIFLSALYPVPLALLVCVRVIQGAAFLTRRPPNGRVKPPFLAARGFGAVAVCLLVGCTGAYFAYFTCCLLAAAGCIGAVSRRSFRPLVPAGAFIALVVASGVVSLAPSLQYQREHGKNEVMKRRADEASVWALRPAELLLPSRRHRIEAFAQVGVKYCEAFQDISTTATAKFSSLGVVGAAGVLFALFGLVRRDTTVEGETQRAVSLLLVFALLVAAPGGFGPLFNFAVSPWVRCYHRMSMLVQFFALVSLAISLTRWADPPAGRLRRWLVRLLVLTLIGFGLYDQTTTEVGPDFAERAGAFRADREYVQSVERALPEGAAVFQLPYFAYPEIPNVEEIDHYGPGIGYIHSDKLRWSHGAMRGRPAEEWPIRVAQLPVREMVAELIAGGFAAVWVDRLGFHLRMWADEAELALLCDHPPVVSANGRYAVYRLPERVRPADEPPVSIEWGAGFDIEETTTTPAPRKWRWATKAEAGFSLVNPTNRTHRCRLFFSALSDDPGPCYLKVSGLPGEETVLIGSLGSTFVREVEVPPGSHPVRFACDGKPYHAGPRTVVFALLNTRVGVIPTERVKP